MEEDCSLVTENGDKCGDISVITKTVNEMCKGYCRNHISKIIDELYKKYNIVTINDVECKIIKNTVIIKYNNFIKFIDELKHEELTKLFNKYTLEILIEVKVNENVLTHFNKNINWGDNHERWITSNWNINGNTIYLNYTLDYKDDNELKSNDLLCKNVEYKTESFLGKGSFGNVSSIKDSNLVIKKIAFLSSNFKHVETRSIKELCFLSQFHHNNITTLKCVEYPERDRFFKFHLLNAGKSIDKCNLQLLRKNILYIMYQLLSVLSQMSKLNIIHGDLKPANIAIDENFKVTILDWGSVCLIPKLKSKERWGTPLFCSPESYFLKNKHIAPINDIWSLGMTLAYIYTGKYEDFEEVKKNILINNFSYFTYDTIDDENVITLLKSMLVVHYKSRKSAEELLQLEMFSPPQAKLGRSESKLGRSEPEENFKIVQFSSNNDIINTKGINNIYKYCENMNAFFAFVLACKIYNNYDNKEYKLSDICSVYLSYIMLYDNTDGIDLNFLSLISNIKINEDEFHAVILDILQSLNFIIFEHTFDLDIKNANYDKILNLMLQYNNPTVENYK